MSTKTKKITLSSSVLKWARRTLFGGKIDEAATKLSLSRAELELWETTDPEVTIAQLRKISKVYKRHISVLLLKTPPKSLEAPKFRKLQNFDTAFYDSKTFLAIRQAQEIQQNTILLLENKSNNFIAKIQSVKRNAENLASEIINYLHVDEKIRHKGRNTREQLIAWKRLMESAGIIVLEIGFPLDDARAFTIFDKIAPVIVLNNNDTDNARIFSLFHELGHIYLGQSDVDYELDLSNRQISVDEIFCNAFAAEFLVPSNEFNKFVKSFQSFDDENVLSIAKKFRVSTAVIWRRLYDYNYINRNAYNSIQNKLSQFEWSSKTKGEFKANKNTHLYQTKKRKGELFISEVFNAYNQNRISYYDMLNYIGLKSAALNRLQRLMFT